MELGEQSLSMAAPVPRPAPAPIAAPMRAWRPRCPARREDTCCTLERERVWSAPLDRMMMASSLLDWNWPLKDFLLLTTTRTCCPRLSCLRLFHAGFWAPHREELTSRPRSGSTTRRQNGRTANLLFRTHRSYTHSAPFFRQPQSSILNCCNIAISLIEGHECNRKQLSLLQIQLLDLGETSGRKQVKTSERRGTAS